MDIVQEFEIDERLRDALIDTYNEYQLEEKPLPYIMVIKKNPRFSVQAKSEEVDKPKLTKSQKVKLKKQKASKNNNQPKPDELKAQTVLNVEPAVQQESTELEPSEIKQESEAPVKQELTKSQKARLKKKAMKKKKKIVIPDEPQAQQTSTKIQPPVKEEPTESVELIVEEAEPVSNGVTRSDSTEPKPKKPRNESFRRVKEEDVDPELLAKMGSNAFKNKKGAQNSFGAKADEDLVKTRGKSFIKEKNKKKRGAYRGGKIDTQAYSIKYESDD